MNGNKAPPLDPPPEELDAYLHMGAEDIARLVLCLLVEEALRRRLAAFRQDLPAQPAEGLKELGVARHNVMLVRDGPG